MSFLSPRIREVWQDNFEAEMALLRNVIDRYPYVAMDTEFPGIVSRPIGRFKGSSDYHYQTLRCNVDLLKIIQLGLTVCDAEGNEPPPGEPSTWQFNFRFSVGQDMCAPESLDVLLSAGLDFDRHATLGIDPAHFGELLITSGLVLFDNVRWVSFHSGYDFGYLLKVITNEPLPATETAFFEALKLWFPKIYDIKFLLRYCSNLKGGLQEVADELQVQRVGRQHQAGSDAQLTGSTFFRLRTQYFNGTIDDSKLGCLYGFSAMNRPEAARGFTQAQAQAMAAQQAQTGQPIPFVPPGPPSVASMNFISAAASRGKVTITSPQPTTPDGSKKTFGSVVGTPGAH